MKRTLYLHFIFMFLALFFVTCGQPTNSELDLILKPDTNIELENGDLQSFCQGSSSAEVCQSLIPLYTANVNSFMNTNWFQEKNLCNWKGVRCNEKNQMTRIDLALRKLSTIPSFSFAGLPFLQELHLFSNELKTIPENAFAGLSHLEWLNLSFNQLDILPRGAFHGLIKLKTLDLQNNQLATLDANTFQELSTLEYLNLHFNQMHTIKKYAFTGLSNLKFIFLNDNNLTTLEKDVFDGLSTLERMDLYNNDLTTITSEAFYTCTHPSSCMPVMPNVKIVSFDNNANLSSLPNMLCKDTKIHISFQNTKVSNCQNEILN